MFSKFRMFSRLGWFVVCAAVWVAAGGDIFAAEGKGLPIELSNEVLKVSIDCKSAAVGVVDLRSGR